MYDNLHTINRHFNIGYYSSSFLASELNVNPDLVNILRGRRGLYGFSLVTVRGNTWDFRELEYPYGSSSLIRIGHSSSNKGGILGRIRTRLRKTVTGNTAVNNFYNTGRDFAVSFILVREQGNTAYNYEEMFKELFKERLGCKPYGNGW